MDKYLDASESASLTIKFRNSKKRLILLDYDGTLVPLNCDPSKALPDSSLSQLLHELSYIQDVELVIISGRHREFLDSIFKDLKATIFAEHGAIYRIDGTWYSLDNDQSWQKEISRIIQETVEITPGSYQERKENSLVWHYRKSDSDLAEKRSAELIEKLTPTCDISNLTIMKGRKIIEVKPSEYTKGTAILNFFDCRLYDFILAAGDDTTDEDLFEALPPESVTVHVGQNSDLAAYTIKNSIDFVSFLKNLIQVDAGHHQHPDKTN